MINKLPQQMTLNTQDASASQEKHMIYRRRHLPILICLLALTVVICRYVVAEEQKHPGPINFITAFDGQTCLVVFDLGKDGTERTVLINPMVTDIGGRHFLSGVVTDKHRQFRVVSPGSTAFVALDRISYIQILEDPKE